MVIRGCRSLAALANASLAVLLLPACSAYNTAPPQPPPNLTILYGVDPEFMALYTLDTAIGVHRIVGSRGSGRLEGPTAMAVRPRDNEVFVYNNADDTSFRRNWGLLRLDRCTGFATRVGPQTLPRTDMGALAFAGDNRLYGFGKAGLEDDGYHTLYEIDPATGDHAAIGQVEQSASYSVSAADFHPDGDLYGVGTLAEAGDSSVQILLIVDTETGRPSIVGEISEDVGVITSIVFEPSGKLLGAGADLNGKKALFEIDPASAEVSSIRRATVAARGMGFAPPISCVAGL